MTTLRLCRAVFLFAAALFVSLDSTRAEVGPQVSDSQAARTETPEEWLERQEKKFGNRSSEQETAPNSEDADDLFTPKTVDNTDLAAPKTSDSLLPEDQERDIENRREEIRRRFTADEIRRARRKVEEERYYRRLQEEKAYEARKAHVSTANFGHVYRHNNVTRGALMRKERVENGMSVGEYYGNVWKHVPVATAVAAPLRVMTTNRTHNADYFYQAVLEQSLSRSFNRQFERSSRRRIFW